MNKELLHEENLNYRKDREEFLQQLDVVKVIWFSRSRGIYVDLVLSLPRKIRSDCAAVNKVKRSLLYWGDRGKSGQGRLINSLQRRERQVADGSRMLVFKTAP